MRARLPRGLEELHDIAIWVLEQDLLSAWSFHDLVPEAKASALHFLDACLNVLELDDKAIPTSRLGPPPVRHRLGCAARPAGRAEALGELGAILESARSEADRRRAETGWIPLLGGRDAAAAQARSAGLSSLLEEVRSALIRAQHRP